MALGDGWTSQLLAGLAVWLDAAGVGEWKPNGAYASSETAIVVLAIPDSPDRLITLTAYPVDDAPKGSQDVTVGVQARIRGTTDPRSANDIGDALFEVLDSCRRQTWGDIPIVDAWRQSYAPLGFDGNKRWLTSHNYYVYAMRRTAHRTN